MKPGKIRHDAAREPAPANPADMLWEAPQIVDRATWKAERLTPYVFQYVIIPDPAPNDRQQLEWGIRHRGVLVALDVLADGRVIDGRTRLEIVRTLALSEVPVRILHFRTPLNLEWYAVQRALARRHLSSEDKFSLAESLLGVQRELARRRQMASLKQFQHQVEALPGDPTVKGRVIDRVARALQMKPDTTRKLITVIERAPEAIRKAVAGGAMSIHRGYEETRRAEQPPRRSAPAKKPPRARGAATPAAPPPRPRLQTTTVAALQELHHQVAAWLDKAPTWPPEAQDQLRIAIRALAREVDEYAHFLSDWIRGAPTLTGTDNSNGDLA